MIASNFERDDLMFLSVGTSTKVPVEANDPGEPVPGRRPDEMGTIASRARLPISEVVRH
jgi:hypothetical protein